MGTYSEIHRLDAYVDNHVLNGSDWAAVSQNARARQSREIGRLIHAVFAWLGRTLVAWQRLSVAKRRLSEMPDHLLQDIGVRRDQIPALAAGRLQRAPSALEQAAADPSLSFIRAKARADEHDAPEPASPIAA